MRNSLTHAIERRERDLLDRLCWQLRDAQLVCKRSLLVDDVPAFSPSPSLAIAGGLVGASLSPNLLGSECKDMSRRRFLTKGALVTGGAVGGLLLTGETQQAEAYWGQPLFYSACRLMYPYARQFAAYTIQQAYSAFISWVVPRVCEWVVTRYSRSTADDRMFVSYSADDNKMVRTYTAEDMIKVDKPAPTESKFHNEFAIPLTIAKAKHVEPRKVAWVKEKAVGVKDYLKPYDGGLSGLQFVKESLKKLLPTENNLEMTQRVPFDNDRFGAEFKKVATAYGYKPGDYSKPKYRDAWLDRKGNEYLSFLIEIGKEPKILIAKAGKKKADGSSA